jgi:hypothetical protein
LGCLAAFLSLMKRQNNSLLIDLLSPLF